jgi:CHAT domain
MEAPRPPELKVEFAGCDVVRAPPDTPSAPVRCKLGTVSVLAGVGRSTASQRRLTLWIEAPRWASVNIWLDGHPAPSRRVEPLPGALEAGPTDVEVYEGAAELSVTAEAGGATATFVLPLITQEPTPEHARFVMAASLRGRGEAQEKEAARLFDELSDTRDPVLRARATAQLARVARLGGDARRAMKLLYAAIALDARAGLLSDEIADSVLLVKVLVDDQPDLEAASQVLDGLEAPLREVPVGRALVPFYRARIAVAHGDLGDALRWLDASAILARRLALSAHLSEVYQEKLEILALLGRDGGEQDDGEGTEANVLIDALRDPRLFPKRPCAEAQLATNLAWHAIVAGKADGRTRAELERALELFGGPCPNKSDRRNVRTNLALLELEAGHLAEAERALDEARGEQLDPPPLYAVDWSLAAGHLELLRSRPDAASELFDDAAWRSRAAGLRHEVAADFGLAESLEALSREDDAIDAYAAADEELDHWTAHVLLGAGEQTFADRYQPEVSRYLDLLVRRAEAMPHDVERVQQAACVARRSRARVRTLAEWQHRFAAARAEERALLDHAVERSYAVDPELGVLLLDRAAEDLAGGPAAPTCEAPAADEVLLVYHPITPRRAHSACWAGFAITKDSAVVAPIEIDEAEVKRWRAGAAGQDLAKRLLEPFADVLAAPSLRRVRFLASEPLARVDLDRLSRDGHRLDERFSVTYGVDSFRPPRSEARGRKALVVMADAALHTAAREAETVEDVLRGAGWRVVSLKGTQATRSEVLRYLEDPEVELFHYVGHSFRTREPDAWGSHLSLGRGERLDIADVLALRHVPLRVVLSSCETDAAGDGALVAGMGIAPALVITGSEVVVAMVADPKDALMTPVMRELYTHHFEQLLNDPAEALRRATRSVQRSPGMASADLPALRVLVR